MVRVDEQKCKTLADHLGRVAIPEASEEGPLPGIPAELVSNFYFLVVAVCHQTSPRGGPVLKSTLSNGEEQFGWDYLRKRLAERIGADLRLAEPEVWCSVTPETLEGLLEDELGRNTLSGGVRRAELIRDLGETCKQLGMSRLEQLFTRCCGFLVGEPGGGLYDQLASFQAFQDPVRKKSSFFLELMRSQNGWTYRDPENLGAPVDYHEVRGHLRIGTVVIEDPALLGRLQAGVDVSSDEDIAIRDAVSQAIALVARLHGRSSPATLHYLFWNTFRSCCRRDHQHCDLCDTSCPLPTRYREAYNSVENARCFFASVCNSAGRAQKLIEHQHTTDYY